MYCYLYNNRYLCFLTLLQKDPTWPHFFQFNRLHCEYYRFNWVTWVSRSEIDISMYVLLYYLQSSFLLLRPLYQWLIASKFWTLRLIIWVILSYHKLYNWEPTASPKKCDLWYHYLFVSHRVLISLKAILCNSLAKHNWVVSSEIFLIYNYINTTFPF